MKKGLSAGFEEISHTADWALHVWAPDLVSLFLTAAVGMNSLMKVDCLEELPEEIHLALTSDDLEGLLVTFLSEILYQMESSGHVFIVTDLEVSHEKLIGRLKAYRSGALSKEIKAVTYHNLIVEPIEGGFQTTIVFDV
jgi:SHS2 domain-containing protein